MDAVATTRVVDPNQDSGAHRVAPWALASAIANALLIVTGGLVRLTKSGLGCPTWPKCKDSYLPDSALGVHGVIEFGNRTLTFVLVALAIVTFVQAWKMTGPLRLQAVQIALWIGLGIIGQAVVGGITVLTKLNPWIVGLHLVLSLILVGLSVWLWWLTSLRGAANVSRTARNVVVALTVVSFVVMSLGSVVTGAGPNSGDDGSRRNGLALETVARYHGFSVWIMIGLTITALFLLKGTKAFTLAVALLVLELVQGAIGYYQYFNGLRWTVVVLHMVMVAVLSLVISALLFSVVGARRRSTYVN